MTKLPQNTAGSATAKSRKPSAKATADKTGAKTTAARQQKPDQSTPLFNVVCVAQAGRLAYEAVIFVRSFRATNPDFKGKLIVATPTGARWNGVTALPAAIHELLSAEGVTFVEFENKHFGQSYPHGNKIEMLSALPDEPFIFFDTDTIFMGSLADLKIDFARPSASMRREGTWPEPPLYGPGYAGIWKSLYDRFDLEFESTLDLSKPDEYWERYIYFSAGWFFGESPKQFGERFLSFANSIRNDPPDELACQSLDPWLDQVALPLVIHSFGGGRPDAGLDGLDGAITCHYRFIPLLYARESDAAIAMMQEVVAPNPVKRVIKEYEPIKKLVLQRKGERVRALFDQNDLPKRERVLRNTIKRAGFWMR
ncbi:hypothetical protein [Albirhodobacter sp. R86504]|uniref:hypothetical protein n=1 Tax=Albirhodobacter sp. R86504 TaxID=3093848 RepID=UPI0036731E58